MQGHRAWHFVGMNGRLDVYLGPCALFAVTKNSDFSLGSRGHHGEFDRVFLDSHIKSAFL